MSENQEQAPVEQAQQPEWLLALTTLHKSNYSRLRSPEVTRCEKQNVEADFDDLQKQVDTMQQEHALSKSRANFKSKVNTRICGKSRTTPILS